MAPYGPPIGPPPGARANASGARILLAIDYGTTYTGLAWMQTTAQDAPALDKIILFRNWPEIDGKKVPSAYSYSPTSNDSGCKQWGYSIDENSKVLRWTKMDLEPRTAGKELKVVRDLLNGLDLMRKLQQDKDAVIRNDVPRYITKRSEDIVQDYLTKVFMEWYKYMRGEGQYTLEQIPLDIIITHPSTWSYEAFNKTFRAVRAALPIKRFPTLRDIYATSEPEACALYTIQDLLSKKKNSLVKGECIVVCDAGGGTVDLVSYYIDELKPLKLTRIGGLTGEKCGATLIDQAFLEWLDARAENLDLRPNDYGTGGHMVTTPNARNLLSSFENYKHKFSGQEAASINLPRGTKLAPEYQDEEDGVDVGQIKITAEEIKKMFKTSVDGAIKLISQQIIVAENTKHKGQQCHVSHIFIAGGFAENNHFMNEVKRFAQTRDHEVQRAEDCWSGVVKGAVLKGMGIGTSTPQKLLACPRNYGISSAAPYRAWEETNGNAVRDAFHVGSVVPDQLIWAIRQGDLIRPEEPTTKKLCICIRFTQEQYNAGTEHRVTFVAGAAPDAPCLLSDVVPGRDDTEVFDISFNAASIPKASFRKLRNAETKTKFHTVDVDIDFTAHQIGLNVSVSLAWNGTLLGEYETRL